MKKLKTQMSKLKNIPTFAFYDLNFEMTLSIAYFFSGFYSFFCY